MDELIEKSEKLMRSIDRAAARELPAAYPEDVMKAAIAVCVEVLTEEGFPHAAAIAKEASFGPQNLFRLVAARAILAERERCAGLAEAEGKKALKYEDEAIAATYCDDVAAAIRKGEAS